MSLMPIHFRLWLLLAAAGLLGALSAMAADNPAADSASPAFEEVKGLKPVSTLTLTEDGTYLVIAHERDNLLSIWDVEGGRVVKTIATASPRFVLSRGGKVFVANIAKSTISAYDPAKEWKLVAEYILPEGSPFFLAAPAGKYFANQILMVSGDQNWNSLVMLLNTRNGRVETVRRRRGLYALLLDDQGKRVIELVGAEPAFGSKRQFEVFDFAAYAKGDIPPRVNEGDERYGRFYAPPARTEANLWFTTVGLWAGIPPQPVKMGQEGHDTAIPDALLPLYYTISGNQIVIHRADVSQEEVARQAVTLPQWISYRTREHLYFTEPVEQGIGGGVSVCTPQAVTLKGVLNIFVMHIGTLVRYAAPSAAVTGNGPLTAAPEESPASDAIAITVDEPFKEALAADARYAVLMGPEGLSVSQKGLLSWTPTGAQIGSHDIKIRVEEKDRTWFYRKQIEVTTVDMARRAGSAAAVRSLGRHFLSPDGVILEAAQQGREILLLQDRNLRVLDADGLAVIRTVALPETYTHFAERDGVYVGVVGTSLQVLDKQSLRLIRQIDLDGQTVAAVAFHPQKPLTYVAMTRALDKEHKERISKPVLEVNESTGAVRELPGVYADRLAMDPRARMLFATLSGNTLSPWFPKDWHFRPQGPRFMVLISYEFSDPSWRTMDVNPAPIDGRQLPDELRPTLLPSPDGQLLACLDDPKYAFVRVPIFLANDLRKRETMVEVGARSLSFHPALKLIATADTKGLQLIDLATGQASERRLEVDPAGFKVVEQVLFSPAGRHLLVVQRDDAGRRVLQSYPLVLSRAEGLAIEAAPHAATAEKETALEVPATAAIPRLAQLEGLSAAAGGKAMSPKEIGRRYMDAVVLVESKEGFGTGSFIGSEGYVLTCAHVLPRAGDLTVRFRAHAAPGAAESVERQAPVRIVSVDRGHDLALLKADLGKGVKVPIVALAAGNRGLEMGEAVTVIGNPGLGRTVLDYTMTTGIVSAPHREIAGRDLLQSSAAVNPGNSGGPMFDEQGRVIGVVVLKATIQSAAFAVTADDVVAFLKGVARSD